MSEHESKTNKPSRSATLEALKAEALFGHWCFPDTWFWQYPEWKQAAISILSSGIFEGPELKGHSKRGNYPISDVLGDLVIDLAQKHFDYDVNRPPSIRFHRLEGSIEKDILAEFDGHFGFVAAIARLGGVTQNAIQKVRDEWGAKVLSRAANGKIPHLWRNVIMNEIHPDGPWRTPKTSRQQIAREFADIFLRYVPATVPVARIVESVNLTLKSLGRATIGKSTLNTYIKEHRQISPMTPMSITE